MSLDVAAIPRREDCDLTILAEGQGSPSVHMYNFINVYDGIVWRRDGKDIPNSRLDRLSYPYTLEILTQDDSYIAIINGQELIIGISGNDRGKIILRCSASGSTFDNFEVEPLP